MKIIRNMTQDEIILTARRSAVTVVHLKNEIVPFVTDSSFIRNLFFFSLYLFCCYCCCCGCCYLLFLFNSRIISGTLECVVVTVFSHLIISEKLKCVYEFALVIYVGNCAKLLLLYLYTYDKEKKM